MSLGTKLRLIRKERGLTQILVCRELNISRSVYSQYELDQREPSMKRLIAISRFFMTSLDYLCNNTEREYIDITNLDSAQKAKIYAIIQEYILTNLDN